METLFAPWRMEFIEKPQPSMGCILCHLLNEGDEKMLILERTKEAYVVMNKYPYSNGHLMVVPNRHEGTWTQLTTSELTAISSLTQKSMRALDQALKPQGYNLGVNLGKAAGAGIAEHVHQHIVPRWVGDFNFMPLLGEVKVISEHLMETYGRLQKVWKQV